MRKILQLSLEEESAGITVVEEEKTFYASIDHFDILLKAVDREYQEQYQVTIPKTDENQNAGRMRVRATTKNNGETEYVQTLKIKADVGENETSHLVTIDVFKQFKLIATNAMLKTRYTFPIEGRKECWEVDVFKFQDGEHKGKVANWCKIDYEFKDPTNREIPPLPEGFSDVIAGDTTDQEEKDFIRSLYEKIFLTKLV